MAIHVSSWIKDQLALGGPEYEGLFITKFAEWKAGQTANIPHLWFEREKLEDCLYHCHHIPSSHPDPKVQEARKDWMRRWRSPHLQHTRRSDRYVVYAEYKSAVRHDWLLIAIIDDPGAHNLWLPLNRDKRDELTQIAQDFNQHLTVP